MPIRAGDKTPAKYYLGDVVPSAVYCGDELVWPIYAAAGMNKTGSHSVTTAFADVTGWSADTAYPGSQLSGNAGLVVQQPKQNATITVSLVGANSGFSSATFQLRAMVNNVVIGSAGTAVSVPASGTNTATLTVTGVSVATGDVVRVQAVGSAPLTAQMPGWVRIV